MSTTQTAFTAHLECPAGGASDKFLRDVCDHLHTHFGIEQTTLQIKQNGAACALAPERKL